MILVSRLLFCLLFVFNTYSAQITNEELREIGASCEPLDSCEQRRSVDSLDRYTCHCSRDCYKYGTCCFDAATRRVPPPDRIPTCREVNDNQAYFVTDSCPPGQEAGGLCEEDLEGDLMAKVPVTSLTTNKTYKNYFCLKCNEAGGDFKFWNVRVNASSDTTEDTSDLTLDYDHESRSWLAAIGENGASVPVAVLFEPPEELSNLPKVCLPGAVSTCPKRYQHQSKGRKCRLYTSYIYILKRGREKTLYRNPHCALCNSENLDSTECAVTSASRASGKRPMSFALLLDINLRDGDRVGMVDRCPGENRRWDPFFKRCRDLTCAIPGHRIRNGSCSPP